jgi:hypothetical protein
MHFVTRTVLSPAVSNTKVHAMRIYEAGKTSQLNAD